MNRSQIEKIYKANGLDDYTLENVNDLLKVHGIDYKSVPGYTHLSEDNKSSYKKFLITYLNSLGMESKIHFYPTGIHFVELIAYYIEENDDEGPYFLEVGTDVIDQFDKKLYQHYRTEGYEKETKFSNITKNKFLRIDYIENPYYEEDTGRRWLHITHEGNQWF